MIRIMSKTRRVRTTNFALRALGVKITTVFPPPIAPTSFGSDLSDLQARDKLRGTRSDTVDGAAHPQVHYPAATLRFVFNTGTIPSPIT